MGVIEGTNKVGKGLGGGRPRLAVGVYDSTVDSKTTGEKTLRGDTLPAGAIVTDALLVVETALEAAEESKVSAGIASATDLQAAKKTEEAPWSTTGGKRCSAVTATAAPITLTEAKAIKIKIETHALTKGKFRVIVTYVAT